MRHETRGTGAVHQHVAASITLATAAAKAASPALSVTGAAGHVTRARKLLRQAHSAPRDDLP
jgi:hypothetical protein